MKIAVATQEEVQAVEELMGLKAWVDINEGICYDITTATFSEAYVEVAYFRDLYDSFPEEFENGEVGSDIFQEYPASEIFDEVQAWLDKYKHLCIE